MGDVSEYRRKQAWQAGYKAGMAGKPRAQRQWPILWWLTKRKYRLVNQHYGAYAYEPVSIVNVSDNHWLCVMCFDERRIGRLQNQGRIPDIDHNTHKCTSCGDSIVMPKDLGPERRTI